MDIVNYCLITCSIFPTTKKLSWLRFTTCSNPFIVFTLRLLLSSVHFPDAIERTGGKDDAEQLDKKMVESNFGKYFLVFGAKIVFVEYVDWNLLHQIFREPRPRIVRSSLPSEGRPALRAASRPFFLQQCPCDVCRGFLQLAMVQNSWKSWKFHMRTSMRSSSNAFIGSTSS